MAKPITAALLVRSGRFENTDDVNKLKVIAASGDIRTYRFHNTDRKDDLLVQVSTLAASVLLEPGGSVDLTVPGNATVSVGKGKGVYDLLSSNAAVRSGAFQGTGAVSITIAQLGSKPSLYRVINGHASEELIIKKNGTEIARAGSNSSVDVEFEEVISVSGNDPIGVYDLLLLAK